ncbi:hypothetical protein AcW1_000128 [Taiwanofungus camphoratus]|nr:hypothetical protein AcV5_004022 [Antrodia cinnamomea]KAI0960892.1 hypothetical protein AcV7_000144 [Antrodia cinnamomea]KAI0962890.1 hypothetical protein AcW1_000128 [Antrodia cinnamomea]
MPARFVHGSLPRLLGFLIPYVANPDPPEMRRSILAKVRCAHSGFSDDKNQNQCTISPSNAAARLSRTHDAWRSLITYLLLNSVTFPSSRVF